ncbi:oligosaccharide flippase family protein [Candidatus Daviesbacteria bacterium]|nr:oligosaccharide flippase family protein [Candidatus Daviesbacteria bacterium]
MIYRLSNILGLDLNYFIKGGFWITLSLFATTIGGIILSSLFSRLWPSDVYGQFSFLMSVLALMSFTTVPGLSPMIVQEVAKGNDGIYREAIKIAFKWSLLGMSLLTFGSLYFYLRGNPALGLAIFVSALVFPISACFNFFQPFLNGKRDFKNWAFYSFIAQYVSIIATGIALWQFSSLVLVALFSAWSTAVINIILTLYSFGKVKNKRFDKKALKFGLNLSLGNLITTIPEYLDKFLIPIYLGFTANAVYAFAILIPSQIHNFFKIFLTLGQPKIAASSKIQLKKNLYKKAFQLEILVLSIVILYLLSAPSIFDILYPSYKNSAVFLSQLFSLSLLYYPTNLLGLANIHVKSTQSLYLSSIVQFVATILPFLILLPTLGLLGVVLAKIVSKIIMIFFQIYMFKKLHP